MRKKVFLNINFIFVLLIFFLIFFFNTSISFSFEKTTTNCKNKVDDNTNCIQIISGIFPSEVDAYSEDSAVKKGIIDETKNTINENELVYTDPLYNLTYYKITDKDDLTELEDKIKNGELSLKWENYNKKYCTYRNKTPWNAYLSIIRWYKDENGNIKKDEKALIKPTNFVCEDTVPPRIKVYEKDPLFPGEKFFLKINITDDENNLLYYKNQKDTTYLNYYDFKILNSKKEVLFEKEKKNLKVFSDNFSLTVDPEKCKGQCKIEVKAKDSKKNINTTTIFLNKKVLSLNKDGYCNEEEMCFVGGTGSEETFENYILEKTNNFPLCVKPGEYYNNNYCDKTEGWVSRNNILLGNVLKESDNYNNIAVYCNSYNQLFNPKSKKEIHFCNNNFEKENKENSFCDQSCISLMYNTPEEYKIFYSQSYNETKKYSINDDNEINFESITLPSFFSNFLNINVLSKNTLNCNINDDKKIISCKDKRLFFDYNNNFLFFTSIKNYDYNLNNEKSSEYSNDIFKSDFEYIKEKLKKYYNSNNKFTLKLDDTFSRVYFTDVFSYKKSHGKEIIGSIIRLKDKNGEYTEPIIILYYKGFNNQDRKLIYKILTESIMNPKYKIKDIKKYEDNNNLLLIGLTNKEVASEQLERFSVRLRLK